MRGRRTFGTPLAILFTLVFGAACADSTMPEPGATDLPAVQIGEAGPSSDYVLPPVTVTVPQCDPWTDLNWCEASGGGEGGGTCMSGLGTGFEMSISSCPIGGGGGGGGSTGGGTGASTMTGPAAEGPLAWGACVLAVLGSVYAIDQVSAQFASWYDAQKDLESAVRTLESLQANSGSVTPEMMSLWEFRVDVARTRRDDAIGAVRSLVNASYWALGTAAVSCGFAAFLPTP